MRDDSSNSARRSQDSAPVLVLAALAIAMCLTGLGALRRADTAPVNWKDPPPVLQAAAALRDGETIDVNEASSEELQLLPRVGPAIAGRIVEARPFASIEDLTRVRGIGPRTLERLRPLVAVGGTTDP